ncbi:OLC1v1032062C1 [Oldenlandia corymbosa var. corymbosa]|uniref:OLC1v1032062C1 n=1 Tax=Oldenlandia corymbosa var. corymbosa TaxID=529605 RepID=A0AAV1CN78_OLDCO|nr:OLC1v1032062C1 [Oldenlandia corymbosa var. corymbosa]
MTQKMVRSIEIKSGGDVFHEIFRDRPHDLSTISPTNVKSVDLHDGEWGKVGSVTLWKYNQDGKEMNGKAKIEAIDEAKKSVRFKVIEGDLVEAYKTFFIIFHVDTVDENNLVTWTLEYEKQNESSPDPDSFMEVSLNIPKDIETHHLQ